ncbi:tail assembly protein [Xenorhabdus vietnamensis]|uniref:Tail assembly protein n=1 Tax=Xenorhabdus vietnamensis TaxID=351656 RepID=A0A1Y2S9N7_9GAMM|nr:hypothetical protein [Xenorhabdus vietnamensis]OTA14879.1 tail assembly protein [Xenorhabdus vietnamensis]
MSQCSITMVNRVNIFLPHVGFLPVGVGIPAHSCVDKPGENKEDYAICRSKELLIWE